MERPAVHHASAPRHKPVQPAIQRPDPHLQTHPLPDHPSLPPTSASSLASWPSNNPPANSTPTISFPPTVPHRSPPKPPLREMLALDPTLSHLEVTTPALEDAFLALTSA